MYSFGHLKTGMDSSDSQPDEFDLDGFDDFEDFSLIANNKRSSKSGAALFDDLLKDTGGDAGRFVKLNADRQAAGNICSNNSRSTGTVTLTSLEDDEELEMLRKLVEDDDSIDRIGKPRQKIGGTRAQGTASPSFNTGLDIVSALILNESEECFDNSTPTLKAKQRASFSTQKTNIKSLLSSFHLDPELSVSNLFEGDDVSFEMETAPKRPSIAERQLMLTLMPDFLEDTNSEATASEDSMRQLFTSSSQLGMDQLQNRNNLVMSSFVSMDPSLVDSSEVQNDDMLSRVERHGLFSDSKSSLQIDPSLSSNLLFKDSISRHDKREKSVIQNLSYDEFMRRLTDQKCYDLKQVIRRFVCSILGPKGDGISPPTKPSDVDYVFKGTSDLVRRCSDFFEAMQEHFREHQLWKFDNDEQLLCTRDHLERFVMSRIADLAFAVVEAPEEDTLLSRRMKILSFLQPEVLDIKPEMINDMVWAIAIDELRKINAFKNPDEKIACVVKSASILFRSLNLARAKSEANPEDGSLGADDFLPAFIYVVLKSNVPRLQSNCEYIQAFHSPERLMGKSGYCFVNLRSSIEFILSLDASQISIDPEYFDDMVAKAESDFDSHNS